MSVLITDLGFETSLAHWRKLDPELRKLAELLVAAVSIPDLRTEVAEVNGWPAIVGWSGAEPFGSISLAVADGRIEQVLVVVNPAKLAGLVQPSGEET